MSRPGSAAVVAVALLAGTASGCGSGAAGPPRTSIAAATTAGRPAETGVRGPASYQAACAREGGNVCAGKPAGTIPAALRQAPHFPRLHADGACPTSSGEQITTPLSGTIVALGKDVVRIRVDNSGDLHSGIV